MKTIKITTTISNDNTIYIPPVIRKAFNFKNGDKVSLEVIDGALIIKPCFDVVNWAHEYLIYHALGTSISYKMGRDREKGITTVILPDGRIGVSQCSSNDNFYATIGEAIALARALGEDDKIPKEILSSRI